MEQPIKVFADGSQAPASDDPRTDHVAVYWPESKLLINVNSVGHGTDNFDASQKVCDDFRLLDHDTWKNASPQEWMRYVLDLTKHDPAVDQNLYPGIKTEWHWTDTKSAWSSAEVWYVGAGSGHVGYGHRDGGGFALPVCRLGQ